MGAVRIREWREQRGSNLLDGGAPWFDTYRTADGGYMAVGVAEARFYAQVLQGLGLAAELPAQHDRARWPQLREKLAEAFARRTRDEWCAVFDASDACVTPVLGLGEAPEHPQAQARASFVEAGNVLQPAPAPASATPSQRPRPAPRRGRTWSRSPA